MRQQSPRRSPEMPWPGRNQLAWPARLLSIAALAVVVFGDLSRLSHAVVAVGLAVAAADRAEDARAEFRNPGTGAGYVDDEALPGLFLTEQPGVALKARKAATLL